jgi:predicted outer membrane repeat protein
MILSFPLLIWLGLAQATQIFSGIELVTAINNAGENFAGILRADILLNLTSQLSFRGTFNLDGNGQTLRCSGGIDPLLMFMPTSTVVIRNLIFQSCPVGLLNASNSSVLLEHCTLSGSGLPLLLSTIDCALQLQDSNVSASPNSRTVQVLGGSLHCEDSRFGPQIILAKTTQRVDLVSSAFSRTTVNVQDTKCLNGTLSIENSTFSSSQLNGHNISSALLSDSSFDASPVSLRGHSNKCNLNGTSVCLGPTCCTPCGLHAGLPYGRQGSGNGYFNISSCTFRRAATSALSLYWHHSRIETSVFDSNRVQGSGGAMYCGLEDATALIQACTLTNNSARDNGGAIFFQDSSWPSQVLDCCFHNNTASRGGALFYTASTSGPHLVKDSGFFGNSGAAVWLDGQGAWGTEPLLTISQSTLAGNDLPLDVTFTRPTKRVLQLDSVTLAYNALPVRLMRASPADRLSNVSSTNLRLLSDLPLDTFFDCVNWTVWDSNLGDVCAPVPAASEPVDHACLVAAPPPVSSAAPTSNPPATSQLPATTQAAPVPSVPPVCGVVITAGNCSQNGNSTTIVGNATATGGVSLTTSLNITNNFNLNSQALLISVGTQGSPLLIVGGCADLTGVIVLDLSQLAVTDLNGATLDLVSSTCLSGTPEIELENAPNTSCLSVASAGLFSGGLYTVTLSLVDSCSSEELATLTAWQIGLAALGGAVVLVVLALITYLLCARDHKAQQEDEPSPSIEQT